MGQWIRDVQMEIEKSMIAPMMSIPGAATQMENEDGGKQEQSDAEMTVEKLQVLQERKEFYHSLVKHRAIFKYVMEILLEISGFRHFDHSLNICLP